ncbi:hypothetical protein SADUNF_Sadunf17G0119900 [Salix dunnii]|uniref:Uncharacterized protein n=1 Tax=Salix dunnii TaxID=1413687 RepID=A0A835MNR8_9ROSI|nr:hypothetical protein SADUNF_Sadunf17G0119900 [Salix dunnii]
MVEVVHSWDMLLYTSPLDLVASSSSSSSNYLEILNYNIHLTSTSSNLNEVEAHQGPLPHYVLTSVGGVAARDPVLEDHKRHHQWTL